MIDKKIVKNILHAFALIMAGEIVFLLPFVVTRIFRPTFLEVFQITNFELGSAFSVYGVVAMVSYFFGGPIADRFESRNLISLSLVITSLAGFIMATIPSLATLTILYGFWGLSTILLFWSAFTKATRVWGGKNNQGRAFGLVDGGRGLIAALLASASVKLLDVFLPEQALQTNQDLTTALSMVIYGFSITTLVLGILVLVLIPRDSVDVISSDRISWAGIKEAAKRKSIWKQSLILVCAYVAYKCTDDFSLYGVDVLHLTDVDAAYLATIAFWMRPVGAFMAGWLGDRSRHSTIVSICFGIIIIGGLLMFSGLIVSTDYIMAAIIIVALCAGIFGLRGLYYALFEETDIPLKYTGSAVGLVSVIGFTPDVFFGPLMGYILDAFPGKLGHEYLFGVLVLFGLVGLMTSISLKKEKAAF